MKGKGFLIQGSMLALVLMVSLTPVVVYAQAEMSVYPAAVLPFEEKGISVKEFGQKAADIVFAKLSARPDLSMVERKDLDKILQEAELNLSGMVDPMQATKIGQLTGAKIIITGSVFEVDKKLYIVAKAIGTETSRVFAASVEGDMAELASLSEQIAQEIGGVITDKGQELLAVGKSMDDRITILKNQIKGAKLPKVFIQVQENHVGQTTLDPAAQTELMYIFKECGFEVIDSEAGNKNDADVIITGEGFSEFALRKGNLVSVKARLELKAVDNKNNQDIAADRITIVKVDLAEQIAGKQALQEAAAALAERMIPKLVVR